MENLFEQALLPTEAIELNKLKENKAFVMRLINDLERFYHIYRKEVKDDIKSTTIWLYPSSSRIPISKFVADAVNVQFRTKLLVYRELNPRSINMTPEWCFDGIYQKYKDVEGTEADKSYLEYNHGHVTFCVPITTENLNTVLRDVMRLLEKDGFKRNL